MGNYKVLKVSWGTIERTQSVCYHGKLAKQSIIKLILTACIFQITRCILIRPFSCVKLLYCYIINSLLRYVPILIEKNNLWQLINYH